ncbi:hypothetical protein [Horticoccus sp. 23ND18S-11]|uniref:hypothetical protein n=1 Tax=Horticoccus sp. 23ND18S-11 TaxID=3391832 RepID=UPI0039C8F9CA
MTFGKKMRPLRFFDDWEAAKLVARLRGGVVKRSNREGVWVFFPSSGHIFDTLNDVEQKFVRRSRTFGESLETMEEIRNSSWIYYEDLVSSIVMGKTRIGPDGLEQSRNTTEDDEGEIARDEDFEVLVRDLDSDSEDFARSQEDGWYYSDGEE